MAVPAQNNTQPQPSNESAQYKVITADNRAKGPVLTTWGENQHPSYVYTVQEPCKRGYTATTPTFLFFIPPTAARRVAGRHCATRSPPHHWPSLIFPSGPCTDAFLISFSFFFSYRSFTNNMQNEWNETPGHQQEYMLSVGTVQYMDTSYQYQVRGYKRSRNPGRSDNDESGGGSFFNLIRRLFISQPHDVMWAMERESSSPIFLLILKSEESHCLDINACHRPV